MSFLEKEPYIPSTQRGVLYFNTVPRDMRPQEVRLHFNRYGDIRRMKFIPFPKKARRPGGALLPLQYKEGWMEFTSADDARNAALCKNGQPVDVKRQRKCYGQLWTVRFMDDFTWDSLLEEAEGKRRARRAAEVDAQREERSLNEAYRRMAMRGQQHRSDKRQQQQHHHEQRDSEEQQQKQRRPVATEEGVAAAAADVRRTKKVKKSTSEGAVMKSVKRTPERSAALSAKKASTTAVKKIKRETRA